LALDYHYRTPTYPHCKISAFCSPQLMHLRLLVV
jgi:hypothetical protein